MYTYMYMLDLQSCRAAQTGMYACLGSATDLVEVNIVITLEVKVHDYAATIKPSRVTESTLHLHLLTYFIL